MLTVGLLFSIQAHTVSPTAEEMKTSRHWVADKIDAIVPELPFSFTYAGECSRQFLALASQARRTWDLDRAEAELDEQRTQCTLTYTDPATGLVVRCEAVVYGEHAAVEWLVTFQNNGDADTPILEDVLAMDVSLTRAGPGEPEYQRRWVEWKGAYENVAARRDSGEFVVHHAEGGNNRITAFQPLADELGPNQRLTIGGISSQPDLPFFNVEWPQEGIIAGVGWTAPWRADFARDAKRSLSVRVAMTEWAAPWQAESNRSARFYLRPGERVRMPRILVLFWHGDRIRAHNLWRRLIFDHYSPRPGGTLVQVPMGTATQWRGEQENIARIRWHVDNGLPIEHLWMDIGWQRAATEEEAFEHLADDVVNEKLFPNGLRAVSDFAHEHGVKLILWFGGDEQCRFQAIYPYLDRVRKHRPELLSEEYPGVDNGNPMITRWMIEHYGDRIAELGVDIFRWDSRSTPPPDASDDRRGINWARSAEGFYEFWDALLARFPDLWIDCCGGGAVNLDLETMSRSVVLWRCDYQCADHHDPAFVRLPSATQAHTYGISFWSPLSSGPVRALSSYAFRSGYSPGLRSTFEGGTKRAEAPEGLSEEDAVVWLARKLMAEYLSVRHCFYGDYYPLTGYSLEEDAWMAWQFDRPDLGEGIVQAFRRSESAILMCQFPLRELERDATYELTDFDTPEVTQVVGADLMDEGVVVRIRSRPGATVIRYRRAPQGSRHAHKTRVGVV